MAGALDILTILQGDALSVLRTLESESVQCCVTSPPYWGLRDYGLEPIVWDETVDCDHEWKTHLQPSANGQTTHAMIAETLNESSATRKPKLSAFCHCSAWRGCSGLEPTPKLYVQHIVQIFRELKRVLRKDGTLWLNLGDCYATGGGRVGDAPGGGKQGEAWRLRGLMTTPNRLPLEGLKPKDLVGIPWRVAFALQADGWWLRSDIIWAKPNPMPESVTDRPTRSHEYIFLLSKSRKYYFDSEAVREPSGREKACGQNSRENVDRDPAHLRYRSGNKTRRVGDGSQSRVKTHLGYSVPWEDQGTGRNLRSVWTIATAPYSGAHFATFPPDLITRCILAGSKVGDVILDPYAGSGTTGKVAIELGRKAMLIEPKAAYVEMIERRCRTNIGLPI